MPRTPLTVTRHAGLRPRWGVFLQVAGPLFLAVVVWLPNTPPPPPLQLPTTPTAPPRSEKYADDELALRVQSAISNDAELGRHQLKLLVNVLDGVAVIGGPVPTQDVRPRLEAVVSTVEGVRRVKLTVWVPAPANVDPFVTRVGEVMSPPQPSRPEPKPASAPPPVLLSVPTEHGRAADTAARTHELSERLPGLSDPVVSVTTSDRRPLVAVPGSQPPPYPPIPATNLPTEPVPEGGWQSVPTRPDPFDQSVTELKRSPKFGGLRVEVSNGTAVVKGTAARHADAWDFADEVRNLPSVQRVVVGDVRIR
jgi:hypothetical protein